MTIPMPHAAGTWFLRLFAAAVAGWAVYRFILYPDWCVHLHVGSEEIELFVRSWVWTPPEYESVGGTTTGIRWGHSMLMLAGSMFMAIVFWTMPERMARMTHAQQAREQALARATRG